MPTRAELPSRQGHLSLHHLPQETSRSWTDDLPVCRLSGVGLSTNQVYREDGQRREEYECEDRSFHFRLDENTYFYGVFDGHEGYRAAHFAAQHMPAEVLLGQLHGQRTDKEIKEILHNAFDAVERGFFESIDDLLAEKANIQFELPEGLSPYEMYQKCPDLVDKLHQVNGDVSGGTTAVVALIYNDRLYVANVGDSRALLCRQDKDKGFRVTQLSVDHDLKNEDELLRFSLLGLNVDKIRSSTKLGNQHNTRCLGNYVVKSEYKDFDILKDAKSDPVIAEPEIHGGITIDESFLFLILMSDGLYKAYEEATGSNQSNRDIAQMVVDQFSEQSTVTGVAQAVVDKVVRLHHDKYMSGNSETCQKRDDISFLVRQFHCPMPNAPSNSNVMTNPNVNFGSVENTRYVIPANDPIFYASNSTSPWSTDDDLNKVSSPEESQSQVQNVSSEQTPSTQTTSTSDLSQRFLARTNNKLQLDNEGKIQPYVDFSDFYRAVQEANNQTLLMGCNGNIK